MALNLALRHSTARRFTPTRVIGTGTPRRALDTFLLPDGAALERLLRSPHCLRTSSFCGIHLSGPICTAFLLCRCPVRRVYDKKGLGTYLTRVG